MILLSLNRLAISSAFIGVIAVAGLGLTIFDSEALDDPNLYSIIEFFTGLT